MTTTDLMCNLLFILILLVGVWYFFIRDTTKPKPIEDDFSISLDEYEKELHGITSYTGVNLSKEDVDWKQIDRDTLNDEDFETMYQETKDGEKLTQEDLDFDSKNNKI